MCSRSPRNLEFGHFMLFFCRGRQRNVLKFKTNVHDYFCSLNLIFCGVVVTVAFVVVRSSLIISHCSTKRAPLSSPDANCWFCLLVGYSFVRSFILPFVYFQYRCYKRRHRHLNLDELLFLCRLTLKQTSTASP